MLTKLQAVNSMLGTIRESPVSTLNGSLPEDALLAKNILDEVSADVQRIGWAFNIEKDVTLYPDIDGNISLPADIIDFEVDPTTVSATHDPVSRGKMVYCRARNSYDFTGKTVKCRRVYRLLDWEYLPDVARKYIAERAARVFSNRVSGSEKTERDASIEEMRAFRELRRKHGDHARPNMLNSPGVFEVAFRNTGVWL